MVLVTGFACQEDTRNTRTTGPVSSTEKTLLKGDAAINLIEMVRPIVLTDEDYERIRRFQQAERTEPEGSPARTCGSGAVQGPETR